ncbi:MAG TPA: zinc ribbon domain-containing protein [Phycisphaerae bacterium]|nr:zinc ribbon domain-containing protein [Phycisphaerae bacterium]
MSLSRTAAVLFGVLVLLIGASAVLWFWVGTGKPEMDAGIATTLQNYTCAKCGHNFALTMAEVSQILRSRGQVCCPKCGECGAHKSLVNRGSTARPNRPASTDSSVAGAGSPAAGANPPSGRAATPASETATGAAGKPAPTGDDARRPAAP